MRGVVRGRGPVGGRGGRPRGFPGRRPDLRLGLAALAAVLAGGAALAQERVAGDLYVNPRYGIEIRKPAAWHFITAGTVIELAKRAGGFAQLRGEDDPVALAGFAVVVSKVPVLGRGFDPQVVVMVHELPEPPADLTRACDRLPGGMTEPETLRPSRAVRLGERPAVRLDFQGLVDGTLVRATALCTARGRQVFAVVAQALAAEFDGEFATFEAILGSFRVR